MESLRIISNGKSQFVLILFMLSCFNIYLVGYVAVSELIIMIMLPFLIIKSRENLSMNEASQLMILGMYLITAFIFNFLNDSDSDQFIDLMGLYGILFVMLLFCYMYILPRPETLLAMLTGAALGQWLPFLFPTGSPLYSDASVWNAGWVVLRLGMGSSSLILLFILVRNFSTPWRQVMMLLFSLLILMSGDRSTALVGCLVALISLARTFVSFARPPRLTWGSSLLIIGVAPVLAAAVLNIFVGMAHQGMLPEEVATRTVNQFSNLEDGVIAARPDTFSAALAVLKKPIMGYGASARDLEAINIFFNVASANKKFDNQLRKRAKDAIPAHSLLFSAWIKGGIFGGAFWLIVLGTIFYTAFRVMFWRNELTDVMLLIGFNLAYAIVFEPGLVRVPIATSMTCVAFALRCIQFHDAHANSIVLLRQPKQPALQID